MEISIVNNHSPSHTYPHTKTHLWYTCGISISCPKAPKNKLKNYEIRKFLENQPIDLIENPIDLLVEKQNFWLGGGGWKDW